MSGQAWTWLTARALMPQPERLTEFSRTPDRRRPKTRNERALDEYFKGRTATGRSSGEGGGARLTAEDVRHALGGLADQPYRFGMAAFLSDARSLRLTENYLHESLQRMADAGEWVEDREDAERLERMAGMLLFEAISARSRHETFSHEEQLPTGSAAVLCPKCNGQGACGDAEAVERWRELRAALRRERLLTPVSRARAPGTPRSQAEKQRATLEARIAATLIEEAAAAARPCGLCRGSGRLIITEALRAQTCGIPRPTWYRTWQARYAEGMEIPRRWEAVAVSHVRRKLRLDE